MLPSLVGQFWSVTLTTTPQRRSYRVMSQKYYLSSLVKSLTALWPFVVIQISNSLHFYDLYPTHFNILVPLHTGPNLKVSTGQQKELQVQKSDSK